MMSSTVWERPVLSSASLHSVSSVAPCCYVAGHCNGAWGWFIALALCYSRTVATCLTKLHVQSC
jgi:hypothetical protein